MFKFLMEWRISAFSNPKVPYPMGSIDLTIRILDSRIEKLEHRGLPLSATMCGVFRQSLQSKGWLGFWLL
jgi:hypothetical protein